MKIYNISHGVCLPLPKAWKWHFLKKPFHGRQNILRKRIEGGAGKLTGVGE